MRAGKLIPGSIAPSGIKLVVVRQALISDYTNIVYFFLSGAILTAYIFPSLPLTFLPGILIYGRRVEFMPRNKATSAPVLKNTAFVGLSSNGSDKS